MSVNEFRRLPYTLPKQDKVTLKSLRMAGKDPRKEIDSLSSFSPVKETLGPLGLQASRGVSCSCSGCGRVLWHSRCWRQVASLWVTSRKTVQADLGATEDRGLQWSWVAWSLTPQQPLV